MDPCPACGKADFASERGRKVHISSHKREKSNGAPKRSRRRRSPAAKAAVPATAPNGQGYAMLTASLERAQGLIGEHLSSRQPDALLRARDIINECAAHVG